MGKQVKTIIWVLVIGFLLFYLVTNPEGAANAVRTVGRQLVDHRGQAFLEIGLDVVDRHQDAEPGHARTPRSSPRRLAHSTMV